MIRTEITYEGKQFVIDLSMPIDLALPLIPNAEGPNCFYANRLQAVPVRVGSFVGKVAEGGPVNFVDVNYNPHGNGTHTECYGHISPEQHSVYRQLTETMMPAHLVTITPEQIDDDRVITKEQLQTAKSACDFPALIIRTLPNDESKKTHVYSGSNPPYLDIEAAHWLREQGIRHLLLDLPSVDKEQDEGKLAAHHAFWNYPEAPRDGCTITELIFVPNEVNDGDYWLNLQVAPFDLDAAASRPFIYPFLTNK